MKNVYIIVSLKNYVEITRSYKYGGWKLLSLTIKDVETSLTIKYVWIVVSYNKGCRNVCFLQ